MKRFARLFEFETGQLLLTISEISDLPGTTMSIETQHDGVSIGTGLSFTNRLEAQAAMDEVSTSKAQELHQAMITCITDPGQLPRLEPNFFGVVTLVRRSTVLTKDQHDGYLQH